MGPRFSRGHSKLAAIFKRFSGTSKLKSVSAKVGGDADGGRNTCHGIPASEAEALGRSGGG